MLLLLHTTTREKKLAAFFSTSSRSCSKVSLAMGLFFFFESREANVATFFAVCTVVLTLGPEWFMPSLDPTR